MHELKNLAIMAARISGAQILKFYGKNSEVELKYDRSPLTLADKVAHREIKRILLTSGLPVVSEEGEDLCLDAKTYWLVDPLDGTKDFLFKDDEFTVNIALIDNGRPLLGIIFAPAKDDLYWGGFGIGAWRVFRGSTSELHPQLRSPFVRMAKSRFHDHPDVNFFAIQNNIKNAIPIGSALKFGFLAIAEVDVIPRLVGSSEWDTAAGQAILEVLGGAILNWHTGQSLSYGKPKRRNPRFLALRSPYLINEFKLKDYEEELL